MLVYLLFAFFEFGTVSIFYDVSKFYDMIDLLSGRKGN